MNIYILALSPGRVGKLMDGEAQPRENKHRNSTGQPQGRGGRGAVQLASTLISSFPPAPGWLTS